MPDWLKKNPLVPLVLLVLLVSGCTDVRYYMQTIHGQLDMVRRRQDITRMLADAALPQAMRDRLNLVLAVRSFAVASLQLPDSGSYKSYADLQRDYAVQNLFAAPEFSIGLHTWCYPVVGCAAYRGYFDENLLHETASDLKRRGFDVYTGRVAAYSTLGFFDDPILNTVMGWREDQLVGLIFHELAHQRVYIKDDTAFNESFATAVEQSGIERWYRAQGKPDQIVRYLERKNSRQRVIEIINRLREDLSRLYHKEIPLDAMRQEKAALMRRAKQEYLRLGHQVTSSSGFNRWFESELNNAKLGSVAAYNQYTDVFLAILTSLDYDYASFYAQVEALGKLNKAERRAYMEKRR